LRAPFFESAYSPSADRPSLRLFSMGPGFGGTASELLRCLRAMKGVTG
jgi:hypothetical protein